LSTWTFSADAGAAPDFAAAADRAAVITPASARTTTAVREVTGTAQSYHHDSAVAVVTRRGEASC